MPIKDYQYGTTTQYGETKADWKCADIACDLVDHLAKDPTPALIVDIVQILTEALDEIPYTDKYIGDLIKRHGL